MYRVKKEEEVKIKYDYINKEDPLIQSIIFRYTN
jgi:hypothetical protein